MLSASSRRRDLLRLVGCPLAVLCIAAALTHARLAAGRDEAAATAKPPESKPSESKSAADSKTAKPVAKYETESLRGRVVWLADALRRRYGIETDASLAESSVALETSAGEIYPLVSDVRGKAFMVDKRLRDMDVELLVRRYKGAPLVQTIRLYHIKPDGKYEVDYWCEKCAISMFILKKCECCQGPTELRQRRVSEPAAP